MENVLYLGGLCIFYLQIEPVYFFSVNNLRPQSQTGQRPSDNQYLPGYINTARLGKVCILRPAAVGCWLA